MSSNASNPAPVQDVGGSQVGASGLLTAWLRVRGRVALTVLLILVVYWWLTMVALGGSGDWAFDFRQFWQGGSDVWNGVSPYPSSEELENVRTVFHPEAIQEDFRFPYPASAAVALAPLGAIGFGAAAAIWGALSIASILAAVWILGVRDWRVLAVVITSHPVISSVRLGTFTPILLLLVAIVWRWRDSRLASGGALAVALSLKLFLWPLVVWLAATRRFVAAGLATGIALVATVLAWAAIGFAGMTLYPELLRRLTEIVDDIGLSLVALGDMVGLPSGVARALPFVVGIPLLAVVVVVARREDGERRAFTLALVAAIALTPIVWLHYFTLLVAPLAIARPRFTWVWVVMWIFWLNPGQGNEGSLAAIVIALFAGAAVAAYGGLRPIRPQAA